MKVAIVIGHEESKPGACNEDYGICEFTFFEKFAWNLSKMNEDYEVIYRENGYTRLPTDINKHNPDIIISLHANAYNKRTSGCEVLYYENSTKGRVLANIMQKQMISIPLRNRGILSRLSTDRGGHLLKYTNAPCVILEPFFIDNTEEVDYIMKNYDNLLDSVDKGIQEFIEYLKK